MSISQPFSKELRVGSSLRRGEYLIQSILGQGGMGTVYLATHIALADPVALKRLPADNDLPESVAAELAALLQSDKVQLQGALTGQFPSSGGEYTDHFLREALFLARLQHHALPALYDYFLEDGYWYLVMDYIPGIPLNLYLSRHGPIDVLEALEYAMQLCEVLDYLHAQVPAIIFRDLKPANILILADGTLMLIDFGIARYFKDQQEHDSSDFGSPGYAPPEQYQGSGQTDARSDLYSLGIILHEMLTGVSPGERLFEELLPARHYRPALSPLVGALLRLMTRHEPSLRFQSALLLYQALTRIYRLEECRLYIQEVEAITQPFHPGEQASPVRFSSGADEQMHSPAEAVPSLEQRRRRRAQLQEAHRQRLEYQEQLFWVDEGLQSRSRLSLSQLALPRTADEQITIVPPIHSNFSRVVKISFLLALLLCSSMLILFVSARGLFSLSFYSSSQSTSTAHHDEEHRTFVWQAMPSLLQPQADTTAVYVMVKGRPYVYMGGGYRGRMTPAYSRTLYRYDIEAAHWESATSITFPGMVNNAATANGQQEIYFTAGYSSDSYKVSSLLYRYQPESDTLDKIVPPAEITFGFGSSILADQQGHLYLTQGFLHAGNGHELAGRSWYRYDLSTGVWHLLRPLPVGLGYLTLAMDGDNNILLLGGARDAGQQQQTNELYRYYPALNVWEHLEDQAPLPLSGAASCALDSTHLVLVGGYDTSSQKGRPQSWLFDRQTLFWSPLPVLPRGGSMLGAAACDGKGHLYLIQGAEDPIQPTQQFWEFIAPSASVPQR
ncbi:protein kinase domain-containing protein [Tengunoibacter tsumagoiensis]|uniref:Protein kinase domain-containing protein n=1 Tax=Tengunoibacter tsumagoiensis TaxID=2014871 RepID=A0A401ZTF6_9CHLR|nr:protein kinase [Tengunoibacter tsumagoiensis]GCE10153.1 hypothetical protein KTT_00120 [Tengunoibacter tsumagoiensis]